jgi:hypothetical protein
VALIDGAMAGQLGQKRTAPAEVSDCLLTGNTLRQSPYNVALNGRSEGAQRRNGGPGHIVAGVSALCYGLIYTRQNSRKLSLKRDETAGENSAAAIDRS